MQVSDVNANSHFTDKQIKLASNNALASFLNLTFLPGLAFIYLLFNVSHSEKNTIDH